MFTPKPFADRDPDRLHALIRAHSFGLLVSNGPGGPVASHVPFLLDTDTDSDAGSARLICHLARANPQWRDIEEGRPVLAVFSGPHAYVSPRWYAAAAPSVPTWNYIAIHVYGTARTVHEPAALRAMVDRLAWTHEAGRADPWSLEGMPARTLAGLLNAIVGVEIAVERIEGKRKLSQNRSAADRAGVIAGLRAEGDPQGLAVAAAMAGQDPES